MTQADLQNEIQASNCGEVCVKITSKEPGFFYAASSNGTSAGMASSSGTLAGSDGSGVANGVSLSSTRRQMCVSLQSRGFDSHTSHLQTLLVCTAQLIRGSLFYITQGKRSATVLVVCWPVGDILASIFTTEWSLNMLVLGRKKDQSIVIGEGETQVEVFVVSIHGNYVRIGFKADKDVVPIVRREVLEAKQEAAA